MIRIETGYSPEVIQSVTDAAASASSASATAQSSAAAASTASATALAGASTVNTAVTQVNLNATSAATSSTSAAASASAASAAAAAAAALVVGLSSGGITGKATLALLQADLAHPDGSLGYVNADATASNNGFYLKSGASGSGSWVASSTDRVAAVENRVSTVEAGISNSVKQDPSTVGAWHVVDKYGRISLVVNQDGSIRIAKIVPGEVSLDAYSSFLGDSDSNYTHRVTDKWGRVSFGINNVGLMEAAKANIYNLQATTLSSPSASISSLSVGSILQDSKSVSTLPDILGFISYGQSWTLGFDSQPALSLSQRFNNVMFNGGVRSQSISSDPLVVYTSLVPLVERTDAGTPEFPAYTCGETLCASQTDSFCERLVAENSKSIPISNLQLFSSCPGEGDKKIEQLSKGSSYYTRLITQVQYAYNLSQVAGKVFSVPIISWVQNTASTGLALDGGTAAYPGLLEKLRSDLEEDIRAITGQVEPVKFLIWQMFPDGNSSANRADQLYYRHVKSADLYPHIYCVGGSYYLDQNTTSPGAVHLKNESQLWLGAQLGYIAKRIIVDGVDWQPVRPLSISRAGRILTVKFHVPDSRKLVLDTTRVTLAENYGFNVYTSTAASGGNTEIPISSVSVVNSDTVRIVLSSVPLAGAVLRYASKGTQQGRLAGIRGNLRDNNGDFVVFNPTSANLPLHNWCVCFEESIN